MQPARGRFARFDLDRQIASTFPAHWKVGPAPVFWASQPLEPAEWLALLILILILLCVSSFVISKMMMMMAMVMMMKIMVMTMVMIMHNNA